MIVEMLGAPGSGKTCLLPTVREFFTQRGQRAYSVVDAARPFAARTRLGQRILRYLPRFLHRPVLWRLYYANTRRYRSQFNDQNRQLIDFILPFQYSRPISPADRHHVLHWFVHHTGVYAFLNMYIQPDEVIIVDEGFVHRVVQLFASEVEEPNLRLVSNYLDLIPRPDLLIFLSIPGKLSVQRVFSRGLWKRFQVKPAADTLQFLARADMVVRFAAERLAEKGWPIIEIDNSGQDIETTRLELLRCLADWARRTLITVDV